MFYDLWLIFLKHTFDTVHYYKRKITFTRKFTFTRKIFKADIFTTVTLHLFSELLFWLLVKTVSKGFLKKHAIERFTKFVNEHLIMTGDS